MAITALRISINKLSTVIEIVEDNWILYNIMMQLKNMLNDQVDLLIEQKIKYKKNIYFYEERDLRGILHRDIS
jgi:ParB family transcriptional regulator, chromosome partitioning protein